MEQIVQDLRYGFRMLRKTPGFTLVAVLTLGLGLGANTAVFSVVNAVLLRALPVGEPERLVVLWEQTETNDSAVAYPNYLDWREGSRAFENLAAHRRDSFNLTGAGEPERISARHVTENFFRTLGVRPVAGRDFTGGDATPASAPTAILGQGFWQRRFGGDTGVINRQLTLNDRSYTVVGIAPADVAFGYEADVYVPIELSVAEVPFYKERGSHPGLWVTGRLAPGATVEGARAELDTVMARLAAQYPETNAGRRVHVESLYENTVGEVRPALLVLFGAVGFVLLIACVNVVNLLLARSAARRREIAIRLALGAGRLRIVRQLLTESLLLSLLGGAFGLLLALWGTDLLVAAAPVDVPRLAEARIDLRVLAFTMSSAALVGLVFGLAPALQASKAELNEFMKASADAAGGGRLRLHGALMAAEVALALVLLIGAGLMVNSLWQLGRVDPGIDPNRLLALQMSLAGERAEAERVRNFLTQVEQGVESLPGVESVAFTNGLPFGGAAEQSFRIEGRPPIPSGEPRPKAVRYTTTHGYAETLGVELRKGRFLSERDGANSPPVVVIDETLARKYFPGEDPLGRRLQPGAPDNPWFEIVGVVEHVKHYGLAGEAPVEPQFYFSLVQATAPQMPLYVGGLTLVVRTKQDEPQALAGAVRGRILAIDPNLPIFGVQTMRGMVAESIASHRFSMLLLLVFALVALLLALVGVYGVTAYTVARRTREIGIRMALGAQARDVLRLILGRGLSLVLAGIGAGLLVAYALTRVLASLLYGVSATDPFTFACLSLLLALVALLACYVPARRATKVDPLVALKYE